MKKLSCLFLMIALGAFCVAGCSKTKKCTCTSGGIYEIIDSALAAREGLPVQNVVFDTVLTQECYSLNYTDTTDIIYPENGVVMNEFLTCIEK